VVKTVVFLRLQFRERFSLRTYTSPMVALETSSTTHPDLYKPPSNEGILAKGMRKQAKPLDQNS